MVNLTNITDVDLKKSATTYKKQLLMMPVIGANATLQHMTPMPGIAGRVVLGELSGDIEIGPYDPSREDKTGVTITPRVLETFLGSVIKKFEPNQVAKTVYGELVAQGKALTHADIVRHVLVFLAAQLGQKLNAAIFKAKRNDTGTTTLDLFNGLDTIAAAEIAAGNISKDKKNLFELGTIDSTNAVDALKSLYFGASDELQAQSVKMMMPYDIYRAYCEDYQTTVGAVPYNREYKKTILEGSDGLCELVPLVSKKGSEYIQLTTKGNMRYGYGAGVASENLDVEKHHPFLLDFVSTMFFGTQYETISKERLMIGKLTLVQ